MHEGWHNDDYLILFDHCEVEQKQQEYGFNQLLPGYRLLGLIGWDDFLVMEHASQKLFRIPTIPTSAERRKEWPHAVELAELKPDDRFHGKIKWYVHPIVFGGDPSSSENTTWISHSDHVHAVRYWNEMYSHTTEKR